MNTQQRLDASMELLERSNEEFNPGGNTMIAAELLWGALSIFTDFDHLNREMITVFDDDFHGH